MVRTLLACRLETASGGASGGAGLEQRLGAAGVAAGMAARPPASENQQAGGLGGFPAARSPRLAIRRQGPALPQVLSMGRTLMTPESAKDPLLPPVRGRGARSAASGGVTAQAVCLKPCSHPPFSVFAFSLLRSRARDSSFIFEVSASSPFSGPITMVTIVTCHCHGYMLLLWL